MPVNKKAVAKAANRAHGFDDPAIERHKDELFGTPNAADPTPVDQRYVAPGRVQLEWIGESGPMASARLAAAVQLGLIKADVVAAWNRIHAQATTRIPGQTHHTMSRERDGMSETYTWGPFNYVCDVTMADADVILSGSFGHQFRVLNYAGAQPANVSPVDRFVAPYVDAATTAKVRAIAIDEHQAEALRGVVIGSRGRMGSWTPKP